MTSATTRSPLGRALGVPVMASAFALSSWMSRTGSPASRSRWARAPFLGFTAMPPWVTSTSMSRPGVDTQVTRSVTMGRRARNMGAIIIASLAPAAVSLWPPEPPMI